MDSSEKIHGPRYGKYILIWIALMILTAVTVTVAGINFGALTVATALISRIHKIIPCTYDIYASECRTGGI
jgi:hypothetical protein